MRAKALGLLLLLASCADRIDRPIANPGQAPAAAVAVGQAYQLDGSGSTDPQKRALTYAWTFASLPVGSAASFADPTVVNPSFIPDVAGSYMVDLVVSNGVLESGPASITIEAGPCGVQAPVPGTLVASPGAPAVGQVVQLSAPDAADADVGGDCGLAQTLAYAWSLAAMPVGSTAALTDATSAIPSFTPDVTGDYTLALTLTDSTGLSGSATLTLTAGPCGQNAPTALLGTLNPVVTTPGDDVTAADVAPGDVVQLDASASSDADATSCSLADPLTYAWSFDALPPGSTTALNSAERNPSFTADVPGAYRVRLTVTDSTGRSDTAFLTVRANPCVPLLLQTSFSCATVRSGNAQGLNQPQGVTVDDTGTIFVVNNGDDSVVRIAGGSLGVYARGGLLRTLEDIVFDPGTGKLFLSNSGDDLILQLDAFVPPEVFAGAGQPRSIADYTDCAGQTWLLVAANGDDSVKAFDPTDTPPPAGLQWEDFMTTGGGMDLAQNPRGVTGACVASADRIFATRTQGGPHGVARDTPDIAGVVDAAVMLSTNAVLDQPRDVALTPCATPKVVVAASSTGSVVVVDNCGGGACAESLLATGLNSPWGLWFESANSLLITDRGSNTLLRITGDFCSL
jgi:PKD domain-containing protein